MIKSGEQFVHKLDNEEGMLYKITEDPMTPLQLVKTLSPNQVKDLEARS